MEIARIKEKNSLHTFKDSTVTSTLKIKQDSTFTPQIIMHFSSFLLKLSYETMCAIS